MITLRRDVAAQRYIPCSDPGVRPEEMVFHRWCGRKKIHGKSRACWWTISKLHLVLRDNFYMPLYCHYVTLSAFDRVMVCWFHVDFQTSCTSWYGRYPIIYKVLYMQTVVGLGISEPSTVVFKTQWWLTWIPFLAWDFFCCFFLNWLGSHETHHHGIQTPTIWDKIFWNFFQAPLQSKSNFVTCGFPRFASWDLFSRICESFQGQSHPVQDKEVLCEGGDWRL